MPISERALFPDLIVLYVFKGIEGDLVNLLSLCELN